MNLCYVFKVTIFLRLRLNHSSPLTNCSTMSTALWGWSMGAECPALRSRANWKWNPKNTIRKSIFIMGIQWFCWTRKGIPSICRISSLAMCRIKHLAKINWGWQFGDSTDIFTVNLSKKEKSSSWQFSEKTRLSWQCVKQEQTLFKYLRNRQDL